MTELNATRFDTERSKLCSLCNLNEDETLFHFLAICPILNEYRVLYFCKTRLNITEIINILNGQDNWLNLIHFIMAAMNYRKTLIDLLNF